MIVLHNPRCRKSREIVAHLQETGQIPQLRLYLDDTLNEEEISLLINNLDKEDLVNIIRKKEPLFRELYKDENISVEQIQRILKQSPQLMERPVIILENRAFVAREISVLEHKMKILK